MRNVFVGLLFSTAAVLYLYKGFSEKENIALNVASIFLLVVALVPTSITIDNQNKLVGNSVALKSTNTALVSHQTTVDSVPKTTKAVPSSKFEKYSPYMHGMAAILFFLCVAYVCFFRTKDTFELFEDPKTKKTFKRQYLISGALMIILPTLVVVVELFDRSGSQVDQWHPVFWLELVAVWAFAFYWWIKSREFKHHLSEKDMPQFLHSLARRKAKSA